MNFGAFSRTVFGAKRNSSARSFDGSSFSVLHCLLCIVAIVPFAGCNSFGSAKLVQELRNENERLLTEFRAERDRREKAEQQIAQIEIRLAESEKLLARSYDGSSASRLSSLPRYSDRSGSGLAGAAEDSWLNSEPIQPEGAADGDDTSGLRWQRRD